MASGGSEQRFDPIDGIQVINETAVPSADVWTATQEQHPEFSAEVQRLTAAMGQWVGQVRGGGGILQRDRYVTPDKFFDQMRVAQDAVQNDDVVSGVLDGTEALALSGMSIECDDEDQENIWNQIAADIDLDARLREMWRELFSVSQFYAATWWQRKNYTVQGRDPKSGTKRKKQFKGLRVPKAVSLLDPLKVVPVGNMMFGEEDLAYISTSRDETADIVKVMKGDSDDTIIKTLMTRRFDGDNRKEKKLIADMGVSVDSLWVLNPDNVWRHTATRPQYRRFADIRLKSVFEILDIKNQLREMDRSHLLGATNFIVLITKGSDQQPGKPEEINALRANVSTMARVPVIVGDHRLSIEIITPKLDHTLDAERYNMLDSKIAGRLYQTFITNGSSTKDDSLKLARVIARGMESRRHMLRRAIEKHIINPTYEANEELTEVPTLQFHPKQIALDFDAALASFLFDLRDRGDISRSTILSQIDLDQDDEFRNRKREKENGYDDLFQTTVPFSGGPNTPGGLADNGNGGGAADPRAAGRTRGGNRNGGGAAPGSGQGQEPRNPRRKSD